MILLIDKKLGYSKIKVYKDFNFEQDLCFMFCDIKSKIWNMFFGWKKTNKDDSMIFVFPNKIANLIFDINAKVIRLMEGNNFGTE